MWKSFHGEPVPDLLLACLGLAGASAGVVHIGTDSQAAGTGTEFVTAVCVPVSGGARVFLRRFRQEARLTLADKLIHEAEHSLAVARDLEARSELRVVVHLDVSADPLHGSSRHVAMLAGMVRGNGFDVLVKPDAWCATHVADHAVKRMRPRAA